MTSLRSKTLLIPFICFLSVCTANIKFLDENNWDLMLAGEWMVEFYAPWCPACRALEPVWKEFASWSDDLGIKVGQVDVTTAPGLSGRFMVTALPTIYHVKDGVFRQYRGTRDKDEFISFVEEKKWEGIESIPNWKSPSSIQMSVVSGFFKLSMLLRNIHTQITEEYGIPYWGSYILFAFATIVIGALLGLVLVFLIDCFYPSKVPVKSTEQRKQLSKSDEEEDEGEIVDEEESDEVIEDNESQTKQEEVVDENEEAEGQSSSNVDVRRRRARKAD